MDNRKTAISAGIMKKAPIASACFMGLGQILYLKQYIRGFMLAAAEAVMLFFMLFNPATMSFNGRGPVIQSLIGLITLGDPHPELPVKFRDHSIFMMITGLIVFICCALYVCLYVYNIRDARKSAAQLVSKQRYPSLRETHDNLQEKAFPYMGILPVVILIAFFTIIPLLFAALVAFTNYSSPDHIPPNNLVDWVGFENFQTMFTRMGDGSATNAWFGAFCRVAVWTLVWAFASTVTCYFVGMFFAVLLKDNRIKISAFYRTIFILPYAIPSMLTLFIWQNLLNGTFGPINRTLIALGVISNPIPWLSDPNMARLTLILVNIWIGFPYSMILITSNMTAIPSQLYEAATIDGANKWQQFRSVTFPLVLYQTMPILIMQFAGNINNFGAVFFLTAGDPKLSDTITTQAGATDLFISWIYKLTYNTPNMYNLASVLSILVFVVLVPFAVYNFTHTKSFKDGEI
ncbi:carbohydrate ABC transporter permease [Treponema brennaborense]|uniref:Maltose/maltodextrin transport system permease protein n=1 Tax=Treponema brennaborense (strain DSM 12168 / CIP 105900 / DD5/3) TaxID=906968 RepID=F4LQA8_TREBD|nr:sugar ABC transporter permease [Treponema brennaborense]AEE16129.1 ABC-type transporter, integral membrane subunit [Treponema brennaborense DSM 12168]